MNARGWLVVAAALGGVAAHGQAQQQAQQQTPHDVQALRSRSLAANCAQCHGTDGHAVEGSAVPGLAGMPAREFVAQMNAFRSGARPSTVMQQLARGYSDAQIHQLAAYFAAQPKP
jgi:cytochrome c553